MCTNDYSWPETDLLVFYFTLNLSFLGIYNPHYSELINHPIINETDAGLRKEEGGGHEAAEDKELASFLAFRVMVEDLDNITTTAIKAYTVLCRNCSLPDLALNFEL